MEKELEESTDWSTRLHLLSRMQVDSLIKSLRSVISFYDFSSFSPFRLFDFIHLRYADIITDNVESIYTILYVFAHKVIARREEQERETERNEWTQKNNEFLYSYA